MQLTGRGGIAVDERCQAGEGLWAVGDVTWVALFTHVARYQGRVAADNIWAATARRRRAARRPRPGRPGRRVVGRAAG